MTLTGTLSAAAAPASRLIYEAEREQGWEWKKGDSFMVLGFFAEVHETSTGHSITHMSAVV